MAKARSFWNKARTGLRLAGFDVRAMGHFFGNTPRYLSEKRRFQSMSAADPSLPQVKEIGPILGEYGEQAGHASGHYFHQDLWAARRIYEHRPTRHVDIGSRVDGFIAHLLVFMPVELVDIRPMQSKVEGMKFVQADATRMDGFADNSVPSLSSLHAIEHFGLGRYGDPLDPQACFTAMGALSRVLAPDGRLYFSVPIGRERVVFNAHRVFDPKRIVDVFSDLELLEFSAVNDAGDFFPNARMEDYQNAYFSCGMFVFTKG